MPCARKTFTYEDCIKFQGHSWNVDRFDVSSMCCSTLEMQNDSLLHKKNAIETAGSILFILMCQ